MFYISILPSAILYLAIIYLSNFYDVKLILVVRELAQTCGYQIGMISNIGILLWAVAVAICLFTTCSEGINR